MDWMQFVSALVSATSWPAAIVVIVCLLKGPILGLIPKIRSLKYGEFHIDLTEELKAVQDNLQDKLPEPPAADKATSHTPVALQLAAVSPRGSILHSWLEVEAAIDQLAKELGYTFSPDHRSPVFKMRVLRDERHIDELTYTTFLQLSKVRNDAVHLADQQMEYQDAARMWGSCGWLITQLKAVPHSTPPKPDDAAPTANV